MSSFSTRAKTLIGAGVVGLMLTMAPATTASALTGTVPNFFQRNCYNGACGSYVNTNGFNKNFVSLCISYNYTKPWYQWWWTQQSITKYTTPVGARC